MSAELSRRSFIAVAAGAAAAPLANGAQSQPAGPPPADRFPRQDEAVVRETVGASHTNLERVRELVEGRPALANAAIDWGFGDWETALGAASHTGRRPIAEFLIANGARPDIFAAAMLGWTDAVRQMVAASPGIQRIRGPHGISLLRHAQAGGPQAAEVLAYLESLGDAGGDAEPFLVDDTSGPAIFGEFQYGGAEHERFTLAANRRNMLEFQPAGGNPLRLFARGPDELHPAGAPAVQIRLERAAGRVVTVTVTDGDRVRVGRRSGG